jgi:hypothetical protein
MPELIHLLPLGLLSRSPARLRTSLSTSAGHKKIQFSCSSAFEVLLTGSWRATRGSRLSAPGLIAPTVRRKLQGCRKRSCLPWMHSSPALMSWLSVCWPSKSLSSGISWQPIARLKGASRSGCGERHWPRHCSTLEQGRGNLQQLLWRQIRQRGSFLRASIGFWGRGWGLGYLVIHGNEQHFLSSVPRTGLVGRTNPSSGLRR